MERFHLRRRADQRRHPHAAGADGELFRRCRRRLGRHDRILRAGRAAGNPFLVRRTTPSRCGTVIRRGQRLKQQGEARTMRTTPHGLFRRQLLQASLAAGAGTAIARSARAQGKPEKLVYVGDNGPWHACLVNEVAPAFEKATGIKIDFTLLPIDALTARLKAELSTGEGGIDIVQWDASMAGWVARHMQDHTKLLSDTASKHPDFDWADFL